MAKISYKSKEESINKQWKRAKTLEEAIDSLIKEYEIYKQNMNSKVSRKLQSFLFSPITNSKKLIIVFKESFKKNSSETITRSKSNQQTHPKRVLKRWISEPPAAIKFQKPTIDTKIIKSNNSPVSSTTNFLHFSQITNNTHHHNLKRTKNVIAKIKKFSLARKEISSDTSRIH